MKFLLNLSVQLIKLFTKKRKKAKTFSGGETRDAMGNYKFNKLRGRPRRALFPRCEFIVYEARSRDA